MCDITKSYSVLECLRPCCGPGAAMSRVCNASTEKPSEQLKKATKAHGTASAGSVYRAEGLGGSWEVSPQQERFPPWRRK